jgi:hypothetical protein
MFSVIFIKFLFIVYLSSILVLLFLYCLPSVDLLFVVSFGKQNFQNNNHFFKILTLCCAMSGNTQQTLWKPEHTVPGR